MDLLESVEQSPPKSNPKMVETCHTYEGTTTSWLQCVWWCGCFSQSLHIHTHFLSKYCVVNPIEICLTTE
jgi:hypothetical protein